jgi:hypothetical protein
MESADNLSAEIHYRRIFIDLIPNYGRFSLTFTKLNLHLKFLTVMNKPARYRDRVPDRVDGVAPFLDQLDHLPHLFGRCRALDIQNVGHFLAPKSAVKGKATLLFPNDSS